MTDTSREIAAHAPAAGSARLVRETAFRLFGRFGYDGVSMTHLARECGLTKAGLYWHTEGKPQLYAECMHELVGLFEQHVFAAALAEATPVRQIGAAFEGLESLVADPRVTEGVAGYWLRPATAAVDDALAVQSQFEHTARQATTDILRAAEADGSLALPLPAKRVADAFIAQVEAIVLPLGARQPTDHRGLVSLFAHMFFTSYARDGQAAELAPRAVIGH